MAATKVFRFDLMIHGTVRATTLEEAEKLLDHAFDTEALKQKGVAIEGRRTGVDKQ